MPHSFSNPEIYKQCSDLEHEFAHLLLKWAGIKPLDRVLDIGSGDGKITADIARIAMNGCVLGTDVSSEMVNAARAIHVSSTPNLSFIVMDAEVNIFRNQFDIVTSFYCLHWVKAQQQALQGIKAALVPGGKAVLLIHLWHEELYKAIEVTIAHAKWQRYFEGFINPHQFFTKERYAEMLTTAGLDIRQLHQTLMPFEFPSKRAMELFLKGWLPHINQLPAALKDEFLGDIGNAFLTIAPLLNGKVVMPLSMLHVFASRPLLSLQSREVLFKAPPGSADLTPHPPAHTDTGPSM